jgi:hypothetical protein
MRSTRWIVMLCLLAVLPLAGCGKNANNVCEACANDSDCQTGLTCQMFRKPDGFILNLCGDTNPAMTCPAP